MQELNQRIETVKIADIIIEDRIRTDFGEIEDLANCIKEDGIINPPVVTPEYRLIAGERRIRAMQYLGWEECPVIVRTVKSAIQHRKLEISENENRKDFTFSEKMRWAKVLREEYEAEAKKNSLRNLVPFTDDTARETQVCQSDLVGRVADKVASDVGIGSREKLRKSEYIYERADEEMIKALDDNQLSINRAYIILKQEAEAAKLEKQRLEKELDKQSKDFDQERADAARRLEKQVRIAENLENDLTVAKRLGDPELVKEVDRWKLRERESSAKVSMLEKELEAEKKRSKKLDQMQGYAEAIEEERDLLRDKNEELKAELERKQSGLQSIQDMVLLLSKIQPQLDDVVRYVSVDIASDEIKQIALAGVSSMRKTLDALEEILKVENLAISA